MTSKRIHSLWPELILLMAVSGYGAILAERSPAVSLDAPVGKAAMNTLTVGTGDGRGSQGESDRIAPAGGRGGSPDEDLLLTPVKIIDHQETLLEIRPSDTNELSLKVEGSILSGEESAANELTFHSAEASGTIRLTYQLRPTIIENKGIELQLRLTVGEKPGRTTSQTLLIRNYESAVVEFMEDPVAHTRYALKITCSVRTLRPPREYPDPVTEIKLVDSILLMNEQLVLPAGGGGALGESVLLGILIKGKGLYAVSFKPFPGAVASGAVNGSYIRFRVGPDVFKLVSMAPILPAGRWRVYVRHNPCFDPRQLPGSRLKNIGGESCIMYLSGTAPWESLFAGQKEE